MAEYKVGYCNPPKEHQFKRGVCANPKRRGKRLKPPYERVIEEVMGAPISFQEGGRQKRGTRAQVLVRKHVSAALNGDPESAMRLLQLHKHAVRYAVEGPIIIEFNGLPDRDRGSADRKAAHMAGLLGYPTEKEESEK